MPVPSSWLINATAGRTPLCLVVAILNGGEVLCLRQLKWIDVVGALGIRLLLLDCLPWKMICFVGGRGSQSIDSLEVNPFFLLVIFGVIANRIILCPASPGRTSLPARGSKTRIKRCIT